MIFSIDDEAVYDLDNLLIQTEIINYKHLQSVDSQIASDFVDFINLFGDYAVQTNNNYLLQIWKNSSVSIFWEYMYNVHFWTVPTDELKIKQEELMKDHNTEECKQALQEMLEIFKGRSVVISP